MSWEALAVIILGNSDLKLCIKDILYLNVLPLMQQYVGFIFQQDNVCPHKECVSMNCLYDAEILTWPARTPDMFMIEQGCYN